LIQLSQNIENFTQDMDNKEVLGQNNLQ
jgi:hypothetical protein